MNFEQLFRRNVLDYMNENYDIEKWRIIDSDFESEDQDIWIIKTSPLTASTERAMMAPYTRLNEMKTFDVNLMKNISQYYTTPSDDDLFEIAYERFINLENAHQDVGENIPGILEWAFEIPDQGTRSSVSGVCNL